jgi:hypothetical protein
LEDSDGDGLMSGLLAPGQRHAASLEAVDALFAAIE